MLVTWNRVPRFRGNKTNRCTEFQFYWYYDSTSFGYPFCPSSRVLSRTSALVHFMALWWPSATRSRMELQFHPTPGSTMSSQLHKMYKSRCTVKNSWWRAERVPETCRVVIPIKLEFSTSVGFIHTESVTMHGNTIVKECLELSRVAPQECYVLLVKSRVLHLSWSKLHCSCATKELGKGTTFDMYLIEFRRDESEHCDNGMKQG